MYGAAPGHLQTQSLADSWEWHRKQYELKTRYLEYWNSHDGPAVDFVLTPATAATAFTPGSALYPGYTSVANVLDFTAIAVPVSRADKDRDGPEVRTDFHGYLDEMVYKQYDSETFHNVPVGVQIMGRRLEEESVLAAAEEVKRCLQAT